MNCGILLCHPELFRPTKLSSCLPRRAVVVERFADVSQTEGFMARSRRTPATLISRCSWELSGRKLERKIKKSETCRRQVNCSHGAPGQAECQIGEGF